MTELYLPSSLVEELAEERAQERFMRANAQRTDSPLWWETGQTGTSVLGSSPTPLQLLEEQTGWAQISLRAIMDRVRGLKWFVGEESFDRDIGEAVIIPLPEHPANRLLKRPNPVFDGGLMKMLISGLVSHTGVCYLQKIYDGLNVPVQLWPLPTQFVRPISCNGKVIGAYEVQSHDGSLVHLPEEDVIRIWRPDLKTLYGALGMLGPQSLVFDAQSSMNAQKKAFFDRDATPRTALIGQENAEAPSDGEQKRFEVSWRQSYDRISGSKNGIPAYVPPGFDIHDFPQVSNAQDVELDESYSKQVMAGYGVPKFAVGIDTNVNRATGETTMWAWDQNMIEPMTDLIAAAYTSQMMSIDFGEQFVVAFEDFVSSDKEHALERERLALQSGKISINEARAADSMDPASWGELPRGSIADAPYTGEEQFPQEQPSDLRAGGLPRAACQPTPRSSPARQFNRNHWTPEATWQRNVAIEQRNVKPWSLRQLRIWSVQLDVTLQRLAKVSGVELPRADQHARGSITADDIFTPNAQMWLDLFNQELGPMRESIYATSAEFAHNSVPAVSEFFLSPFMETQLETLGAQNVVNVDATTRKHIGEQLAAGQREGESISQLSKRIESVFRDRNRSRTVARTEVGQANQTGTIEGLRSSGVVDQKVWNTSRDGAVRDSHRIDGQTVALDEPFILLDGDRGQQPLSSELRVGNIVLCRCFVTPVVSGLVDTSDPDQTNEG